MNVIDSLLFKIIPFFERFPLRAKKARDFEIWKEGVRLIGDVSSRPSIGSIFGGIRRKWAQSERDLFVEMSNRLKDVREYQSPEGLKGEPYKIKIVRTKPSLGIFKSTMKKENK